MFSAPATVALPPSPRVVLRPARSGMFARPGGAAAAGPDPTPEQQAVVDAYLTGHHLVITAGAGTGKSSTLRMIAQSRPERRGMYLAYNKAIADEAAGRFPAAVDCRTAHSLAFRAVGHAYAHRLSGGHGRRGQGSSRLPSTEVARILGLHGERLGERYVTGPALARIAGETVDRFCQSADVELRAAHVPVAAGLERAAQDLVDVVLPAAWRIWQDISDPEGRLYFQHDHYLKLYQLAGPVVAAEYVMLDEAQDASPVIAAIVGAQDHAQLAYVGDQAQAIYGFRGAIDAMAGFQGRRLKLTRSFRFGPAVADEANRWLEMLDAELRLVGHDPITSTVGHIQAPRAILCRTNGGSISAVIGELDAGRKVALTGDGKDISRFAWAAKSLMDGKGCDLPELAAFRTWRELCAYVEDEASGRDLKAMVTMVNRYGPSTLINTVKRLSVERYAQVTVSTAHKAKGLEWPTVRIGDDFTPPTEGDKADRAELMLAYVAVTRAQQQLDRGSLSWPDTGHFNVDGTWVEPDRFEGLHRDEIED